MTFTIRANNKEYVVGDHAARRMRERFITEDMIIKALENGTIHLQPHGVDLYEYEYFFEETGEYIVVQVAVLEENQFIKSVIDVTDDN
jgi:hypothetical protein